MELTADQQTAYDAIMEALAAKQPVLLTGSAGTGKTTLTKFIAQACMENNMAMCGIAPTHKAVHVLENVLNARNMLPIPVFTIASILGKMKQHSYIGAKNYGNKNINKLNSYNLFILDEVSMTSDSDIRTIETYVRNTKKRLIIIGDDCQLPCPSAPYDLSAQIIKKKDSYVFDSASNFTHVRLTNVVRQAKNSPIICLATYIRDHMEANVSARAIVVGGHVSNFDMNNIISHEQVTDRFADLIKKYAIERVKIIVYTNASMMCHNLEVRRMLEIDDKKYIVGEIMMGYNSIGFPELVIENGQDYIITDIKPTTGRNIDRFTGLSGFNIDLKLLGIEKRRSIQQNLFFIHINSPCNEAFMSELVRRAETLNSHHSTKTDYLRYTALKNSVLFIDNIYSYNDQIYTEASFKETHPLLFTGLSEVIHFETKQMIGSIKADKINQLYAGIIAERLQDDKPLGDSEMLADKFMVIEKDLYYGYAITTHKSQGSTYDAVIADENDFSKIVNKWNFRHNKLESRIREKNQLRYVAYTRAKHELFISENVDDAEAGADAKDL